MEKYSDLGMRVCPQTRSPRFFPDSFLVDLSYTAEKEAGFPYLTTDSVQNKHNKWLGECHRIIDTWDTESNAGSKFRLYLFMRKRMDHIAFNPLGIRDVDRAVWFWLTGAHIEKSFGSWGYVK